MDDQPIYTPPPLVILPGERVRRVDVYVFGCPLCHGRFRSDDKCEKICTGPGWQDTHAPEVMRLVSVEQMKVLV